MDYSGKWVVRDENDANSDEILDVIEYDAANDIVRAIGKNMSLAELKRRYIRATEVVVDPFAVPLDLNQLGSVDVFVDKTSEITNQNIDVRIQEVMHEPIKNISSDHVLVSTMLEKIKNSSKAVETISVDFNLDIDIKKLIELASNLSIDNETVFDVVSEYFVKKVMTKEVLINALRTAFIIDEHCDDKENV